MLIFLYAMLITGFLEVLFFWGFGYRKVDFLIYIFGVNLLTNFVMNLSFLGLYQTVSSHYSLLFILEIAVVMIEFFSLGLWERKWTVHLLVLVFLANLFTWGSGEILQRFGWIF